MPIGRKLRISSAVCVVAGVALVVGAVVLRGSAVAIVVGGVGAVFLMVGLALYVVDRTMARRTAWLRENGREIWAEVTKVEPDTHVTHNNRPTYFVHATWRDIDGSTHTARSCRLPRNPALALYTRRRVRVYVHPKNPDHTFVDIPGMTA